jgi:oligoendopeptidase F
MVFLTTPQPRKRDFLPNELKVTVWSRLKPYYAELSRRSIDSLEDLVIWINDRSELDAFTAEEFGWRYIRYTCNTNDERAAASFEYAIQELEPKMNVAGNQLDKKLSEISYFEQLNNAEYGVYKRNIRNALELFRAENIALQTDMQIKAKEYAQTMAQMTIVWDNKEITLQQAAPYLESTDRTLRETIYTKIAQRVQQDSDKINGIFDELLAIRHKIAINAGFDNYRDFKFRESGRFDYTPEDCHLWAKSVATEILPVVAELEKIRKKNLHLTTLRPWDIAPDSSGKPALQPFSDDADLIEKTIQCLHKVHPYFAECLGIMREMDRLDLGTRKGKAPGGYNYPLPMSGVPFIFMNASNSIKDMLTMVHESGHAVHSFLTRERVLLSDIHLTPEIAELASMTTELLTMEHWDVFFEDKADLRRAQLWQLEKVLSLLPWIAMIDQFQHWLYTHPAHTHAERDAAWMDLRNTLKTGEIDWSGIEAMERVLWHRQLHIFEVPFYYIEYGMAQLGAIAIWKSYRKNPEKALRQFMDALRLGYSKPIGEVYAAAGIQFEFSQSYIRELADFLKHEIAALMKI